MAKVNTDGLVERAKDLEKRVKDIINHALLNYYVSYAGAEMDAEEIATEVSAIESALEELRALQPEVAQFERDMEQIAKAIDEASQDHADAEVDLTSDEQPISTVAETQAEMLQVLKELRALKPTDAKSQKAQRPRRSAHDLYR